MDTLSRLGPYGIVVAPAGFASGRDVALQRILFAIDGSPTSFAALATGVMLATPDTQIRVVYVVDRAVRSGGAAPTAILEDTFVKEGERAIATASEMLHSHRTHSRLQFSADLIRTDVSSDDISRALLHDAERWHADLMVMGTHGRRGDARSYLGSVPNKVASLAKIPVFLVHERHDGNDHSAAAE
ncbi:universal stress protein [Caballeronia arvi]|uniref:universal stress protein n=1 Tax=Caballeronia arvi TaxID=1777135 RepID=UPI001F268B32|nr:universal stress protein [Caballeronia arvi]